MKNDHARPALAGLVLASMVPLASGHVVLQKWTAAAGYQEYVTLVVPHGCGDSPTTAVRVKIPDGIVVVVPEEKAGWTTTVVKRKLATPIAFEGVARISEVVDEVVWSGGRLPNERLGLFTMLARMPDEPGKVIYFKTIQTCEKGEVRWVDTVAAGEPTWKIWATPAPSPFIELQGPPGPQLGATMQQIAAERARRGGAPAP